jgi:hypothetical protein
VFIAFTLPKSSSFARGLISLSPPRNRAHEVFFVDMLSFCSLCVWFPLISLWFPPARSLGFFSVCFSVFPVIFPFFFSSGFSSCVKAYLHGAGCCPPVMSFFSSFFVIPFLLLFYVFGHVDFTFPFPVGPADKTSANNQPLPYGMFGSGERGGGGCHHASVCFPGGS